ncbi:MAG: hypothetical protein ACSHWS_04900 [Sulfitobacter sp.]
MRDTNHRPAAPNYTTACIVMFGINLMWGLLMIWAIWGFIPAAFTGWLLNHLINRIAVTRG